MNFQTLWRDSIGFWRCWVITLGRRHRLFSKLSSKRTRSSRDGALDLWCAAALSLGILESKAGRYVPAPGVRTLLLNPEHPDYLAGHLLYGTLRSLDYDAFAPFFARGRTLDPARRPNRNEAVEEATAWDHTMFLRRMPRPLRTRLHRGCDVLEFGSGTGSWIRRMRREFPESRFHGSEPDPEAAKRARLPCGRSESFGRSASADVVYLGEVLHLTDAGRTLRNCARVLRPGGWLLILEGFMPERVTQRSMDAVLFAMQLDQALQGVRFIRRSDLALPPDFTPVRFIRLGGCVALAVSRKRTQAPPPPDAPRRHVRPPHPELRRQK